MYTVSDDVLQYAKWHKENYHSRQTVVNCLFTNLYLNKYKELALLWAKNEEIDAELTQLAEEMADKIYKGEI